jgi:hypothetical protein
VPTWLLIAYGIGLIGFIWFAVDSARVPSIVWFWSGYSRGGWWITAVLGFVAFGIPALIVAIVWRFSPTRKGLFHELDELKHDIRRRELMERRTARNVF